MITQLGNDLGHVRAFLADGTVDGNNPCFFLIDNGIDCNSRFSGLPVTQDQFSLPAPDGDQRVNHLDARLKGHDNRSSIHNGRSRSFHGQSHDRIDFPQTVQRPSDRINHPSQQRVPDRHIQNTLGALHFRPHLQIFTGVQKNNADFFWIDIENKSHIISGKPDQFLRPDMRQPADPGNIASDKFHLADLILPQLRMLPIQDLVHRVKCVVQKGL